MKTPAEIADEIERLRALPAGPNQAMYVRGAIQTLVWLTQNATPPHDIYEVVCGHDTRSPT